MRKLVSFLTRRRPSEIYIAWAMVLISIPWGFLEPDRAQFMAGYCGLGVLCLYIRTPGQTTRRTLLVVIGIWALNYGAFVYTMPQRLQRALDGGPDLIGFSLQRFSLEILIFVSVGLILMLARRFIPDSLSRRISNLLPQGIGGSEPSNPVGTDRQAPAQP